MKNACVYLLAAVLLAGLPIAAAQAGPARADELEDLEAQVKQSAAAYNEAVNKQEQLAVRIEKLNTKIEKLEKELPKQQKRSNDSFRALYRYQSDTSSVVLMLLNSKSFTDMLAALDAYNWVIDYNTDAIEKTVKMEKDLKASKKEVVADKKDADAAAAAAYSSLEQAKQAREAARERALAAQRAEAAAKKAAAQQAMKSATTKSAKKAAKKQLAAAEEEESSPSASNVDWSSDKSAFVNKWAPRIDAYLSGSPTAGTGSVYAAAAWDNGVDPRWAPAISNVESGKGAACYRSHNAWGYGGINFSSWAEGINAVVSGLGGSLYGGYLTESAAATYCPSNPSGWYSKVKAEMSSI